MRRRRRRHREVAFAPHQLRSNAPIQVIAFGDNGLDETTVKAPLELPAILGRNRVTWVNVDGIPDAPTLAAIGAVLGLHPLALEDVSHLRQRPKVERYGDHQFIIAQMVTFMDCLDVEQLAIFQANHFVLTFQERPGVDSFDSVRARLRQGNEWLREGGGGRLAYALLDAVVDGYYPVLEHFGERLDALEEEVLARPNKRTMARIHEIKRELLQLRRAIWPMREAVGSLFREPSALVGEETRLYLRDCYDHTIQVIDLIETYRDLGSGLTDLYLSSVSQKMNEVMKVLTIIATIFIPLTFIVGVYGMNFDLRSPYNMPELEWYYGYPFVWALMIAVTAGMLVYFRRKGWLGEDGAHPSIEHMVDSHPGTARAQAHDARHGATPVAPGGSPPGGVG